MRLSHWQLYYFELRLLLQYDSLFPSNFSAPAVHYRIINTILYRHDSLPQLFFQVVRLIPPDFRFDSPSSPVKYCNRHTAPWVHDHHQISKRFKWLNLSPFSLHCQSFLMVPYPPTWNSNSVPHQTWPVLLVVSSSDSPPEEFKFLTSPTFIASPRY